MTVRRLVAQFLCLIVLAGIAGCRSGSAAGQFADDVVRTSDDITRQSGRLDDIGLPPPPPAYSEDAVKAAADDLLSRLDDLSEEDFEQTVTVACYAKDAVESAEASTVAEGVDAALVNLGANATLRQRMEGLAEDLVDAKGAGDYVLTLAVFSTCELA